MAMTDDDDLRSGPERPGRRARLHRTSWRYGLAALGIALTVRLGLVLGIVSPGGWLAGLVFLGVAGYPVALALTWVRGVASSGTGAGEKEGAADAGPARFVGSATSGALGLATLLLAAWIGLRPAPDPAAGRTPGAEQPRPAPRAVVLPLIELNPGGDRYFAAGVTDEIVAGLAAVDGLEVWGRASASELTDVNRDAAAAAAGLGGAVALDGTIRRSAGRVRLTVRLVDTASGEALWSLSRDTTRSALFGLRDDVVRGVAGALGLELRDRTLRRLERRRTSSDALDLYLLGRFRWAAGSRGDLVEATGFYDLAIEADSGFAPAWVALAEAYATLPRFTRFPSEGARRAGAAAARTALQLEPEAAGAHAVLGEILYLYEHDWTGARSHLERARELDPGDAAPRDRLCELALVLGDVENARLSCAQASGRDPLAFRPEWTRASVERVSGESMAAVARLDSLAAAHPDFEPVAGDLVISRLVARDTTPALEGALARWLALLGPAPAGDTLAAALAAARRTPEPATRAVREALARIEAEFDPAPAHLAALLALFGDTDRGIDVASRALAERTPGALRFGVFPEYAGLRERATFRELLEEAGFSQLR